MTVSSERVEYILSETGAVLHGHFILTSGLHSDKYIQCAKVLQYPSYASELCSILADEFKNDGIDIVASPAVGGIIVGYEIAKQLGVMSIFAERENGVMVFRRGLGIKEGMRVLIAEDVVTTGGSVRDVMECVKECGGIVVGTAFLVDRSGGGVDFGVKKAASYAINVTAYEKDSCPMCRDGIPACKPGSRALTK